MFVDGNHENFIPAGSYQCSTSMEITNLTGPDDDNENNGNDEGD